MSRLQFLAVALMLSAAACGGDTTIAPTTTVGATVTDTFSGTLNQNGAASHPFITSTSGSITATLTALTPTSTLVVGLSLGTWNGNSCQVVIAQDKATQSSTVLATASASGSLCVRIYDVGNVIDPVTYEIQVLHP